MTMTMVEMVLAKISIHFGPITNSELTAYHETIALARVQCSESLYHPHSTSPLGSPTPVSYFHCPVVVVVVVDLPLCASHPTNRSLWPHSASIRAQEEEEECVLKVVHGLPKNIAKQITNGRGVDI